jgi:hypothetical protein
MTLVQLEPIGTAAIRAANAVGCNHPPGFKSPILRSCAHTAPRGAHRFINAKTPQPRDSRRYRAYRAGLDASSARISSACSS